MPRGRGDSRRGPERDRCAFFGYPARAETSRRRNGQVPITVASDEAAYYRIRVRGVLPPSWSAWFRGFTLVPEANGDTTLTGPVTDQAALHGLITRIRDLGITLVAVERLERVD